MVATAVALAGISAAGALMSFIQSERARGLRQQERERIDSLINELKSPDFDTSNLEAPDLQILESYTPEVANIIYESDPELLELTSERAQTGMRAQEDALAQLEDIASGDDPLGDIAFIKAVNEAIGQSGRMQDSIVRDLQRQGVAPSSSSYRDLRNEGINQSQANMFNSSLQAALADRARRDDANVQAGRVGERMLGFEADIERGNNRIINEINRRNTQARRDYEVNRANTLNRAQLRNMDERQRVYEGNRIRDFGQAQRAQDLRNKQIQADYTAQRDRIASATGNARFGDIAETAQGRNQAIQGITDAAVMGTLMANKNGKVDFGEREPLQKTTTGKKSPEKEPEQKTKTGKKSREHKLRD